VIHLVHSTTNLNFGASSTKQQENESTQNQSLEQDAIDTELTPISSNSSSLNSSITSNPANLSNLNGSYSLPTRPQVNANSSQSANAFNAFPGATPKDEYNQIYSNLKRLTFFIG